MKRSWTCLAGSSRLALRLVVTLAIWRGLPSIAADQNAASSAVLPSDASAKPETIDFRVASRVHEGSSKDVTSESVTLFVFNGDGAKYHNVVYDFLSSPREVTVLDYFGQRSSSRNANSIEVTRVQEQLRINLLDPSRKVRTELTDHQLETFGEQLRSRAARQTSPLLKFAAQPKFDESDEERDGSLWMKFASDWITYRVQLANVDQSVEFGEPYYRFCDYSARVNSMLHPGALPPFPRLEIDRRLADGLGPPRQVELTISDDAKGGKSIVLRSEHHFSTQLTKADRQRIDEANEQLKTFKQVSWEEYLRPIQQAKR
jgi:hypothetical protein